MTPLAVGLSCPRGFFLAASSTRRVFVSDILVIVVSRQRRRSGLKQQRGRGLYVVRLVVLIWSLPREELAPSLLADAVGARLVAGITRSC